MLRLVFDAVCSQNAGMEENSNSQFDSPRDGVEPESRAASFGEVFSRWLPMATLAMASLVILLWLWLWWTMQRGQLEQNRATALLEPHLGPVAVGPKLVEDDIEEEVEEWVGQELVLPSDEGGAYEIVRGRFEGFGGVLNYEVIFQEHEDHLHYRLFLFPYAAEIAECLERPNGSLFLIFVDDDGARVAPETGRLSIPLADLAVFELAGSPKGWELTEVLPLEDGEAEVGGVRLTHYFSAELNDVLRGLADGR